MAFYQEPASQTNPDRAYQPMGPGGPIREELEQCRPTRFGNDRGGWVGIPPELPQWRPMCFGSKRCTNNRATSAAMGLFQVAPGLCKRPLAAAAFTQELAMPVPMHCRRSCGVREGCLSHPPALRLSSVSGGRVGGNASRDATMTANVLWQRQRRCQRNDLYSQPTHRQRHSNLASVPRRPCRTCKGDACCCRHTLAAGAQLKLGIRLRLVKWCKG
jgi:hypothetical protein